MTHVEETVRSKIKVQKSDGTVVDPATTSDVAAVTAQLDIKLSDLRNAIVGSGADAKTQKDLFDKLEAVRVLLAATLTVTGNVGVSGSVAVTNFPATQPVSGTVSVGNFPATQAISHANLDLALTALRDAITGTGVAAKTLADLNTLLGDIRTAVQIIDDWDEADRAKTNPVVGQAGVAAGAGAVDAKTQRVTLGSDDPLVAKDVALKGTPIAGQALEAGGSESLGWLSSLRKAVTDFAAKVFAPPAKTRVLVVDLGTARAAATPLFGATVGIRWVKVYYHDGAHSTIANPVADKFLQIGATTEDKIPLWTLTRPDSDVVFEGRVSGDLYLKNAAESGKSLILLVGVE